MQKLFTFLFGLAFFGASSQTSTPLISYDFISNQFDTVGGVNFDSTITSDFITSASLGLPTIVLPTQPLIPLTSNLNYSDRIPAANQFNIDNYPFSACVAMRVIIDDTMQSHCSGSMIGENLVVTAAHCVTYLVNNNMADEIYVFPSFDHGEHNSLFDSVRVIKAFYSLKKDIAVLQLAKNIGLKTGWLGYGYNIDSVLESSIMHKMSYPAFDFTGQKIFNGDTLFYENGNVEASNHEFLSVQGVAGMSGQSGSAWFTQSNNTIIYGVASFSSGFSHARITPEYFYSFKNLENYLSRQTITSANIDIYPNPASGLVKITGASGHFDVMIYDLKGALMEGLNFKSYETAIINCDHLKNGLYILKGADENGPFQTKLVISH